MGKLPRHWFAAQTHYRCEGEARRELTQQGFVAEYPMILLPRNRAGVRIARALFEGYVFVQECAHWRSINGTRGVQRLIMNPGEQPARITDDDLQFFIRDSVDERGYFVDPVERVIKPGDVVAPRSGRFAGIYGEFLRMTSHSRGEVLYWMFGRALTSSHLVSDLA